MLLTINGNRVIRLSFTSGAIITIVDGTVDVYDKSIVNTSMNGSVYVYNKSQIISAAFDGFTPKDEEIFKAFFG